MRRNLRIMLLDAAIRLPSESPNSGTAAREGSDSAKRVPPLLANRQSSRRYVMRSGFGWRAAIPHRLSPAMSAPGICCRRNYSFSPDDRGGQNPPAPWRNACTGSLAAAAWAPSPEAGNFREGRRDFGRGVRHRNESGCTSTARGGSRWIARTLNLFKLCIAASYNIP